jgi:phosphinothricin acetyltransferase
MNYRVIDPGNLSPEIQGKADKLFSQLAGTKRPLPLSTLLIPGNPLTLLGCFDGNTLTGMASLATYSVPSGKKGWIEDVVVDLAHRGRGVGRQLVQRLVEQAVKMGCTELLLFTGYERKPAISLYESIGFRKKDSHLYIMKLGE